MGIETRKYKYGRKYRAVFYHRDMCGNRIRTRGEERLLKRDAQDDLRKMIDYYKNGRLEEDNRRRNFYDLAERWLASRKSKDIEFSTIRHYTSILKLYLYPEIGNFELSHISPTTLSVVFGRIRERKLSNGERISPKQYNHVLSTCRSIFNYGIMQKICDYNPAAAVEKIKIVEQPFTFLSPKDVLKLLNFARSKHVKYPVPYYLYLLGLNLGLRIGELIALKWEHINFNNRSIIICSAFDRQANRIKNYPKSKRYRIVWMNEAVENALLELRAKYSESEYVLMNPSGTGHIYYRNFRERILLKDIEESGVKYFDLHGMRHTYAINFLTNKGDPTVLQVLLGHESLSTTMKYVTFANDYIKSKANIVSFEATLPENVKRLKVGREDLF
jgi:integrase